MQEKILVVGRQSIASRAVSEVLRLQGYQVEEAEEGGESLSTIRPEKYAVIISDIVSEGLRVLSSAKAVTPAVPVVLKSNEHILTRSEAFQLGASELIEKSDLVFEQLNKIRSVLDRANRLQAALALG